MDNIKNAANISLKNKSTLSTNMDGEVVILDTANGKYYGLDGVGAHVWEVLQTPQSFKQVKESVLEEFDVDAEQCEQDLIELLSSLHDADLVEIK